MLTISPEKQVRAYAGLRSLEAKALALEELIGGLKRRCLHGGPGAANDLAAATSELRAHLGQLTEQAAELEVLFAAPAPAAAATPPAAAPAPLSPPQPRMPPDRRREAPKSSGMRGTTDVLSVAELMSFLSSVKKTGTLTLQSVESMFVFEFNQGAVVHAVTNELEPHMRLGTILVAQNKLTEQQLQVSLEASAHTKEILGDQLVRSQTVTAGDLRQALEVQVRKIFEAAFRLKQASFTFVDGNLSNIAQRTSVNTMHLLLEAARQSDEKSRIAGPTSPASVPPAPVPPVLDTILPG